MTLNYATSLVCVTELFKVTVLAADRWTELQQSIMDELIEHAFVGVLAVM